MPPYDAPRAILAAAAATRAAFCPVLDWLSNIRPSFPPSVGLFLPGAACHLRLTCFLCDPLGPAVFLCIRCRCSCRTGRRRTAANGRLCGSGGLARSCHTGRGHTAANRRLCGVGGPARSCRTGRGHTAANGRLCGVGNSACSCRTRRMALTPPNSGNSGRRGNLWRPVLANGLCRPRLLCVGLGAGMRGGNRAGNCFRRRMYDRRFPGFSRSRLAASRSQTSLRLCTKPYTRNWRALRCFLLFVNAACRFRGGGAYTACSAGRVLAGLRSHS